MQFLDFAYYVSYAFDFIAMTQDITYKALY